jgi:hypothetical protein
MVHKWEKINIETLFLMVQNYYICEIQIYKYEY